jgi:hypothetical protein
LIVIAGIAALTAASRILLLLPLVRVVAMQIDGPYLRIVIESLKPGIFSPGSIPTLYLDETQVRIPLTSGFVAVAVPIALSLFAYYWWYRQRQRSNVRRRSTGGDMPLNAPIARAGPNRSGEREGGLMKTRAWSHFPFPPVLLRGSTVGDDEPLRSRRVRQEMPTAVFLKPQFRDRRERPGLPTAHDHIERPVGNPASVDPTEAG